MAAYTDATKWLLATSDTRRTISIRELYLGFYHKDPYPHAIGRAVDDVVKRGNTECLQFTIWSQVSLGDEQRASSSRRFLSFVGACPVSFAWLNALTVHDAGFEQSDIPNLLNTCSQLRTLSLSNCNFGVAGSIVEIDAPLSELMVLELRGCAFARVDLIQAPKLWRVICDTWYGYNASVRFGCVPSLHTLPIACPCLEWQDTFALSEWLSNARNLRVMHLDFRDDKVWINPEGPKQLSPVLSTLTRVYLYNISHEYELNWTLFVLEAAPSLENFYIKISRHICDRYKCEDSAEMTSLQWEPSNFEHQNLRLLQMEGFAVEGKVMRYIRKVIKLAVNLKRIRLLAPDPCEKCNAMNRQSPSQVRSWRFPAQEREKKIHRERLTDELFSSVEIII